MPTSRNLEKVEPVYATLKGWKKDTTKIKEYSNLPDEVKEYIGFIEKHVGVRVKYIGVGPARDNLIIK